MGEKKPVERINVADLREFLALGGESTYRMVLRVEAVAMLEAVEAAHGYVQADERYQRRISTDDLRHALARFDFGSSDFDGASS